MDRVEPLGLPETAADLGITRLCHLTPFKNLVHLASDDAGLLSLRQLADAEDDYDQQDLARLDNHPDHISCSIEYPNGWYLRQRKLNATPVQRLFPDWVCLAIDLKHLWKLGTRVCVRNAAASGGSMLRDISPEALNALYASPILGSGGRSYPRGAGRIRASPTDDQAEVMVHRSIPLADIQTVIVASEADARRFHAALAQIDAKVKGLRWAIAPMLLTTKELSTAIATGQRPVETPWEPA